MKGLLVYHSKWGNCGQVAEQVARGLRESGHEVSLFDVKSKAKLEGDFDFLAAGSPTRVGNMTGAMRRFLKRGLTGTWEGKPFAAFGTGLKQRDDRDKKSADRIYELLEEKGLKPLAPALKATVEGSKGPLLAGELENAFGFGKKVGAALGKAG